MSATDERLKNLRCKLLAEKKNKMELVAYLSIMMFSFIFSFNRKLIQNSSIFFLFWLLIYVVFVLIVRSKFDSDINTYANSMSLSTFDFYYFREPVVWLGQRYLFGFIKSEFWVFVSFDVIIGYFLFQALDRFKVPQYAYFSILIFFPFVLGMQNVYRQWVAMVLFLYSFSILWGGAGGVKSWAFFVISTASHNVSALFYPLLLIKKNKFSGKTLWVFSFIFSFVAIVFGAKTKSDAETGADLSLVYPLLLMFFVMLIPLLDRGVFRRLRILQYKIFLGLLALSVCASAFLSSASAERVSMFCMIISYPMLINFFEERFSQIFIIRVLFSALGFIPMLVFGVSKFIVG